MNMFWLSSNITKANKCLNWEWSFGINIQDNNRLCIFVVVYIVLFCFFGMEGGCRRVWDGVGVAR